MTRPNLSQLMLPNYREWGAEQAMLQPYHLREVEFYGFFLRGTRSHLQQLCDRYLNTPAQGAIEYRPLSSYVLVNFDRIGQIRSELSPDREKGFFAEDGEVIFWLPVVAGYRCRGRFIPEQLALFIPYIYMDSSRALVSGREVYGYPKQWGWIDFPTGPKPTEPFTLEAVAWQTFGPDQPGQRQSVLRIENETQNCASTRWRDRREVMQAIKRLLLTEQLDLLDELLTDLPQLETWLDDFLVEIFSTVFLKQMRLASDGNKAAYQAIIEAPQRLDRLGESRCLHDRYVLTLPPLASQPIAQELGLQPLAPDRPHQFESRLSFWLQFDFSLQSGKIIWQAGQPSPTPWQHLKRLKNHVQRRYGFRQSSR